MLLYPLNCLILDRLLISFFKKQKTFFPDPSQLANSLLEIGKI